MLEAKVGDVIRVNSYRGEKPTISVGIVEEVIDIHQCPISVQQYKKYIINRSQFLLTVRSQDENGLPVYRNYYHQFIDGCKLGWFSRLIAKVKGKI